MAHVEVQAQPSMGMARPEPSPALPTLASSLFAGLSDEARDAILGNFDEIRDARSGPPNRVAYAHSGGSRTPSGARTIDEALDGGIRKGKGGLVCVSGEKGVGKTGLSLAFLSSHLFSDPTSNAAVIDTTGNFDVIKLYQYILLRLRKDDSSWPSRPVEGASTEPTDSSSVLEDAASGILDRVKIMRVFDFVGVAEAVAEVREELEKKSRPSPKYSSAYPARNIPTLVPPRTREEVADSEDEDDDEMLFGGTLSQASASAPILSKPEVIAADEQNLPSIGTTSFILVDSIAQVLSPMLKSNYVQTHDLLTSFLRSLTHLTHTHNLTSFLMNATLPTRSSNIPNPPNSSKNGANPQLSQNYHSHQIPSSIFSSNASVPALGTTFPYFLDLHLLVSRLPKSKLDARRFYHGDGKRKVETVSVVEVISDRWEGKVGRWAGFKIAENGELIGVE